MRKTEWFKRGIIAGAIAAGAYAAEKKVDNFYQKLNEIQAELDVNAYGDCVTENITRFSLGAPGATPEECKQERQTWFENNSLTK